MAQRAFPLRCDNPQTASRRRSPVDTIALMDALKIKKATLGGFSTGARGNGPTSWRHSGPETLQRPMVSVSGYLIGNPESRKETAALRRPELQMVVPILFRGPRGAAAKVMTNTVTTSRKLILAGSASPKWEFDDATFDSQRKGIRQSRSCRGGRNPTITAGGSALAEGERNYDDLEKKAFLSAPGLSPYRPSPWKGGRERCAAIPRPAAYAKMFSGKYSPPDHHGRQSGHNLPQEAPQALCRSGGRRHES